MNQQNYSYPIDPDWTTAELAKVINFLRAVEDAYEVGIARKELLQRYREFKTVVSSKAGEKQLGRQFAKASGYEIYDAVKLARNSTAKKIKIVGDNE